MFTQATVSGSGDARPQARRLARRRILMIFGIWILATAFFATGTAGSEPASTDLTEMSLEELMDIRVYAAARREQKTSEVASSVTIITSQEIRDYGWRTLADVLNTVPGLYATYDRAYHYIGVRGFSRSGDYNSRILILLNGTRVNEPIYDNGGVGNDAIVCLDMVERIEVVRGSATSFYGNNALLAVVNIITVDDADAHGGSAVAEYGSFATRRGFVAVGYRLPSGPDIRVSASRADSRGQDLYFPVFDAPETNHGLAEDMDRERHAELMARLTWGDLACQFSWVDRVKRAPAAAFGVRFNARGTQDQDVRTTGSLTYGLDVARGVNLQAMLSRGTYGYDGHFVMDVSEAQDGSDLILNQDRARAAWWGADLKASTTLLPRNRVTAGYEYRENSRLEQSNFDRGSEAVNFEHGRAAAATGLYFEDEIVLADWAHLLAGVRYDLIGISDDEQLSPRTALLLTSGKGGTLKLLYGEAFRSPNPFELYYNDGGYSSKANPDLDQETIRTYEIVVDQRLNEWMYGSAAVFSYTIEDLISQTLDPGDGLLQYNNTGRAEADGTELSLRCQFPGNVAGVASFSYTDARDSRTGAWLNNSPRRLGRLRLAGPLAGARLRGGVELQHEGERRTLSGGNTEAITIANANVIWTDSSGDFELSLTVYNLLDRSFGYPGGEEHTQDEIPADRRNFRVKGGLRF
jgi:iron complex outermembrane receptor protein